jgi:hypothetical protein
VNQTQDGVVERDVPPGIQQEDRADGVDTSGYADLRGGVVERLTTADGLSATVPPTVNERDRRHVVDVTS